MLLFNRLLRRRSSLKFAHNNKILQINDELKVLTVKRIKKISCQKSPEIKHQYKLKDILSIFFPDIMQAKPESPISNNADLKAHWNNFAPIYSKFDSAMQTFYYTLVNMLNITEANHILEIASGIGEMIPYTVSLKNPKSTYLASDLCENMIDLARKYLESYLQKMGVEDKVENWMEKNNLSYRVLDGELPIESPYKFDRIICNLVLMITEDPKRMMQNLAASASEGCLLGLTIWGDRKLSNFLPLSGEGMKLHGIAPSPHDNFYLYNKIAPLAQQSGWEVVLQWEQNAPFPNLTLDENLKTMIKGFSSGHEGVEAYITGKVNETFEKKEILNFPVQMAILRKK